MIEEIERKFNVLQAAPPFALGSFLAGLPKSGIYTMSEKGKCLYVGRSNNIPKRLRNHARRNHNQATFAFLLARKATGRLKASYKKEDSRPRLLEDPEFSRAFEGARERIRNMDIRVVEETDPVKQALFEIYTAVSLNSSYNDFDNH